MQPPATSKAAAARKPSPSAAGIKSPTPRKAGVKGPTTRKADGSGPSTDGAAPRQPRPSTDGGDERKKLKPKGDPKQKDEIFRPSAVDISDISVDVVLARAREVTASVQARADKLRVRVRELGGAHELAPAPEAAGSADDEADKVAPKVTDADRKKSTRFWQTIATEKLAAMASSLEGALQNDDKLRKLFDDIDTDKGGTIDKEELRNAVQSVGSIGISEAQINVMMSAADDDDSGEIDFVEFCDILRGVVKQTKAARIIEKSFRKKKKNVPTRKMSVNGGTIPADIDKASLKKFTKPEVDRLFGVALLSARFHRKSTTG